jgi:RecA/RadA recombinase
MIVPTSTPIDQLTGGLYYGRVALIYGPTGCGKTTLAVEISKGLLRNKAVEKVIYIDSEEGVPENLGEKIDVRFVYSLREQKDVLKELAKSGLNKVAVVIDTLTGHFHRQVLKAPKVFRASLAGDLSGDLSEHITLLRQIVGRGKGIGLVTAHLRSPVSDAFRLNVLRKIAKAYKEGRYVPTAADYERYMTYDPVRWIGGQSLGMHTQYRFRIFVDEDRSRIIMLEKWPVGVVPHWCIRYRVGEDGRFEVVGSKFPFTGMIKDKLYSLEFKTMLGEVLELSEKEGIEVEEAGEGKREQEEKTKKQEEKQKKQKPKPGELKFPKVPTLGDIAEEEESKGGRADESSDSDSDGEGAGGRQE